MITEKTRMTTMQLNEKVMEMAKSIGEKSPHATNAEGHYDDLNVDWWTSGFYPGLLWLMHDLTGDPFYRVQAEPWTEKN